MVILVCMLWFFFFFFSSRRRHTRLQGDWSSDVCSSDLLSLTEMEPIRVPVVLGVKVTLSVQLAPGFTVAPQVFVWANGPVTVKLATVRIPRPVLVSAAFMAGLVVLIIWLGKVRPLGENVTAGNTPVPVSGSV